MSERVSTLQEFRKVWAIRKARNRGLFLNDLIACLDYSRYMRKTNEAVRGIKSADNMLKYFYDPFDYDPSDEPQEAFNRRFRELYVDGPNARYNTLSIPEMFDRLHDLSCFFIDGLDLRDAILACKVMLLLAGLSDEIPFWRKIDTRFSLALAYSHAHCPDKSTAQYGVAVEEAAQRGDLTCEFLAIYRGLDIFTPAAHLTHDAELAIKSSEYWERFLSLCARCGTTPDKLASLILDNERRDHPERIGDTEPRIREAEAALDSVIGFMRGNKDMSDEAFLRQKEAEKAAYGGTFDLDYRKLFQSDEAGIAREQDGPVSDAAKEHPPKNAGLGMLEEFEGCLFLLRQCPADYSEVAGLLASKMLGMAYEAGSELFRAVTLLAWGQCLFSWGDSDQAKKKLEEALKLIDGAGSLQSDIDGTTLLPSIVNNELARVLLDSSPEDAVRHCGTAYAHLDGIVTGTVVLKAEILQTRAAAYRLLGNKEAEQNDLREALQVLSDDARRTFPYLEKSLRADYWTQMAASIKSIISYVDNDSSPELIREAYRSVLLAKGILLSSEINIRRQVMDSGDDELIRQYGDLRLKDIHSSSGKSETAQETFADYVSRMQFSVGMQDILKKHSEYLWFGPDDLVKQIPENAVLIDFFDALQPDGGVEYMAFLMKRDETVPRVVKVATQEELDAYLEKRDRDLVGEIYEPYSEIGQGLYRLFWGKVFDQGYVTKENDVFFSPPGSLEQLVLEALPSPDEFGQICETQFKSFQRVSHAKDVKEDRPIRTERIVLFGDLDYDLSVHLTPEEEAQGLSAWEPIGNGSTELDIITNRVSLLKDVSLRVFRGTEGTDKVFLSLGKDRPGIIHFLSHGFFEDAEGAKLVPALRGSFRPMDMTGIIVSNGNRGWLRGDYFEHEGVLTASQIAEMDLSGVQLVVLSACDLGKGVPSVSEMLGIQRAFKKAGAETVIMSLWHIEDDMVQIFVKRFYNNLLVKGMGRHKAFIAARAEARSIRELADFWAGFIMTD